MKRYLELIVYFTLFLVCTIVLMDYDLPLLFVGVGIGFVGVVSCLVDLWNQKMLDDRKDEGDGSDA